MTTKFQELFNTAPLIVRAPGRINFLGEHTDYNNGYVMPAAIDKGITFAIAPSKDGSTTLHAAKYNESFTVDLSRPRKVDSPLWANYLLGILHQLAEKDRVVKPFNCVIDSDLPTGAGLSSSAAMECGFVFALNELFRLGLSKPEMIRIAQWSEHNYAGVKCGIMDQFASMMGQQDNVIVLDCKTLSYTYSPINLHDHSILLCDTNIKHSLASSEYNTRRRECEEGVAILKKEHHAITSLRDVSLDMLRKSKSQLLEVVYNRCLYVVEENDRVLTGSADLRSGNLTAFGKKMYQTHDGLSVLYEVSCPELDFLVERARKEPGIAGARMMGGGFGGCTINIIHNNVRENFIEETTHAYKKHFDLDLTTYVVNTGNGTAVISNPFNV